jgi:hypothetical protein
VAIAFFSLRAMAIAAATLRRDIYHTARLCALLHVFFLMIATLEPAHT